MCSCDDNQCLRGIASTASAARLLVWSRRLFSDRRRQYCFGISLPTIWDVSGLSRDPSPPASIIAARSERPVFIHSPAASSASSQHQGKKQGTKPDGGGKAAWGRDATEPFESRSPVPCYCVICPCRSNPCRAFPIRKGTDRWVSASKSPPEYQIKSIRPQALNVPDSCLERPQRINGLRSNVTHGTDLGREMKSTSEPFPKFRQAVSKEGRCQIKPSN